MASLRTSQLIYLACALGGLVIFASVVAGITVAAAVAVRFLG